ncbi:peptidase inhibitor family I36 protein [Streptosporangium sp. NPDC023615]|uniref:peptidase inhibitor family I36 protein n=1 Tax=Streptosporangium sp. NPDC023615 TaxID=3154794 RepID=UPI003424610E
MTSLMKPLIGDFPGSMMRVTHAMTRVVAALAGIALGASLAVVSATPALADEHDGWCGGGEMCVFEHENRVGGRHDYYNADSSYVDDRLYYLWGSGPVISGSGVNDMASSLVNNETRCDAILWEDINSGGGALIVPYDDTGGSGFRVNDLRPWGMNDIFSSSGWLNCV